MKINKYFGYDELPEDLKEIIEPPYSKYDWYGYLVIRWDDGSVEYFTDHMEPEDATFGRDLSWIKPLVVKAYERGKGSR